MEIKTTMVRFRFPKKAMEKITDKARLFKCGDDKVWIPLVKLEVKPDPISPETHNECIVPKWVYMKTDLPFYTDSEEFIVTTVIDESQLNENAGTYLSGNGCEAVSNDGTMKILLTGTTVRDASNPLIERVYNSTVYFKENGSWVKGDTVTPYSSVREFVAALGNAPEFSKAYSILSKEVS